MKTVRDFKLTGNGDLSISATNELEFVKKEPLKLQYALARVKSVKNDWYIDNVGADLESLIGEPNVVETIELGKTLIIDALTGDGLFALDEVYVDAIPHATDITFQVFLKLETIEESTVLNVSLSATRGVQV